MKTRTLFRQVVLGSCVMAAQMLYGQDAAALQKESNGAKGKASMLIAANVDTPHNGGAAPKHVIPLTRPVDKIPAVNLQKTQADKITSFFVRANDSKRIQLSVLVAYKMELTEALQKMLSQKVTPLVFSVSTFPTRSVEFDPAKLRFEQNGRIWQPGANKNVADILPLDDHAKFGGVVIDGEVHQGIVLLPAWMNASEPITLRYNDFHYLARFAEAPAASVKQIK